MKRIAVIVATMLTLVMLVGPISRVPVVAQSKVVEPTDRTILRFQNPKFLIAPCSMPAMQRRLLGLRSRHQRGRPMF
jgi:hypothetical protein